MSTSIDSRIVEMRFDNKQFEQGAKETLDTLDKLKKSLDLRGASEGFKELDRAADSVDFSNMERSLGNLEHSFTNFFGITARKLVEDFANFTVGKIEGFVRSIDQSFISGPIKAGFSRYEEEATSVATIFNATKDAAKSDEENLEVVMQAMEKLMWYTDETSAKYSDMVNNIGKFTAAGVDLDTSVDAMMGISNWAYLSGQNVQSAGRVMYNVSQALGVGAMKLMDWKSIENASMATIEFKKNALEAGVAAGTLYKVGDKYYDSLKKTEVTAEAIGQSLQTGWFNKEVILDVLSTYGEFGSAVKEYIDSHEGIDTAAEAIEAMEKEGIALDTIGKKAFLSAQEAKTFHEAWDSATEAITTGWSKTYRLIFGNYLEAKELWTDFANTLYNIFAEPGNVRNEWLTQVLKIPQSMKKTFDVGDFIKFKSIGNIQSGDAASFTSAFEKLIYNTAKQNNIEIDDLIKSKGSLMHTLSTGWLTGDMFKDAIASINELEAGVTTTTSSFDELSKVAKRVELGEFGNGAKRIEALTKAGYDYSLVQEIVNHDLTGAALNMEKFNGTLVQTSGYTEDEIAALKAFAKAAEDLDTPLGQLMDDFTQESGRDLAIEGIKNSFAYLASIIKVVRDSLFEVIGGIDAFGAWVAIRKFRDFSKTLELSEKTSQKLKDTLVGVFTVLKTVFITIPLQIVKALSPMVSIVKALLSIGLSLGSIIGKIITRIVNGGKAAGAFKSVLSIITAALQKVADILNKFAEGLDVIIDKADKMFAAIRETPAFKAFAGMIEKIVGWLIGKKESLVAGLKETINKVKEFGRTKLNFDLSGLKKASDFFSEFARYLKIGWIAGGFGLDKDIFDQIFHSIRTGISFLLNSITGSLDAGNTFSSIVTPIYNNIRSAIDKVFGNIDIFSNLRTSLDNFKESVKEIGVLATLRKTLEGIWSSIQKGASRVRKFFSDLKNNSKIFQSTKDFIEYLKSQISSGNLSTPIKNFFEWISGLFAKSSGLTTIFDTLLPKIKEFVDNTSLRQLLNFFRMGASILVTRNIAKFFGNMAGITGSGGILGLFKTLKKDGKGLGRMMEEIGDAFNRASRESVADIILKLSLAITALAGALYLIGQIPDDRLDRAIGIFRQIFIAVLGAWAVMTFVSNLIWKMKKTQQDLGAEAAESAMDKMIGQLKNTLYSLQGLLSSIRISAIAIGVVAILGAVVLLKVLLDRMADWPMDKAIEALPKLLFLMGILTLILFSTRAAGAAAGIAGIGLVGMMVAIVMLIKLLEYLSSPKITNGTYMRGISTLSQIVMMLVPLMWAMKFATSGRAAIGMGYSMVLIATAIATIVRAMASIAEIDDDGLSKAVGTVMLLMIAIGGLIAVIGHANAVIGDAKKLVLSGGTILAVAVAVLLISTAMIKLAEIDSASLFKAGAVVAGVFAGIILMFQALSKLTASGAGAALAIVTIVALLGGFLWIFDYLSMIDDPKAMEQKALSMAAVMLALGVLMHSMGGLNFAEAMTGVASFLVFLGGLSVVALLIGGIAAELQNSMDVGEAFETFGQLIGRAIGGFISGIGIGLTNDLVVISDNLTKFAEEMKGTIASFRELDLGEDEGTSVFDTVQTLVKIFLELRKFANDQLGLSGVNWALMQNTANNLGGMLLVWSHATDTVDPDDVSKTAGAIKNIVDATKDIKNGEGLSTLWYGNQDLEKFAKNMGHLASGLVNFWVLSKNVEPDDVDKAAQALERIANITSVVGKNGDNWSLSKAIFGETNLEKFGKQLKGLGEGIVSFSQSVSGKDENGNNLLDMTAIENAVTALTKLSTAAGSFNTDNSVVDLVVGSGGKADLMTLTNGLTQFTNAFAYLNDILSQFDSAGFTVFYNNVITNLLNMDMEALKTRVLELKQNVIDEITNIQDSFAVLVQSMTTSLRDGFVNGSTEGGTDIWVDAATSVVTAIEKQMTNPDNLATIKGAGVQIGNKGADGIDDTTKQRPGYAWYNSGIHAMEGFIQGMYSKEKAVKDAAAYMASIATNALNDALVINSPSKITMKSGRSFGEGFELGIYNSEDGVLLATSSLATAAMESLQNTLASISETIFDEVDTSPTITPVLDLSNVQAGSKQIGSMLNSNGINVSNSANLASNAALGFDTENQNGQSTGPNGATNFNFVQNNYSPKALSRIEIYRQTKNQFAAVKEALAR